MRDAETLEWIGNDLDIADRRRTGRTHVPQALLPLLRNPAGNDTLPDSLADPWMPREPLAPSRGVGLALALCTPIWAALGGLLYVFVR